MMCKKTSLGAWAFAVLVARHLSARELPRPIFYVPFDTDTKAVISDGIPEAQGGGAEIVSNGQYGGAARFTGITGIPYSTAGNLLPHKGTICFWVKPVDWAKGDATRTFLNAGSGAPYYTWAQKIMIQKSGLNGEV